MLKCDLKLDSWSKTVVIAGVGRIVWRKECFLRITQAIFKQYVFISEKGNDSCEQQMKEKIVSEYDQEIPQSQTADNPVAPRGRSAQPSQDTRKTN